MTRVEHHHQVRPARTSPESAELTYRLLLWRAHKRRLLAQWAEEDYQLWHRRAEVHRSKLHHPSQSRRRAA
jgi:hypothetical protein